MYQSLIYISRSRLVMPAQASEIDRIVADAVPRHVALGIRGALIFTERHFAHLIEGPPPSIDELIEDVMADPRHEQVTIIDRRPIDGYRFPDWTLAYWGDAGYMDKQVARVLEKASGVVQAYRAEHLLRLIQRLAHERHKQNSPIGRPSGH